MKSIPYWDEEITKNIIAFYNSAKCQYCREVRANYLMGSIKKAIADYYKKGCSLNFPVQEK